MVTQKMKQRDAQTTTQTQKVRLFVSLWEYMCVNVMNTHFQFPGCLLKVNICSMESVYIVCVCVCVHACVTTHGGVFVPVVCAFVCVYISMYASNACGRDANCVCV